MDITFNIMIVSLLLVILHVLKKYIVENLTKKNIFLNTIYLFVPLSKPTDFTKD